MLSRSRTPARQRGLSIAELLIGIAIGLFLIGGTISLFMTELQSSRRLLVDARINQDLRAAADLVARELRRAGYWANAIKGTMAVGNSAVAAPNLYSGIVLDSAQSKITYSFARDSNDTVQNNESFGLKLQDGVLKMQVDPTAGYQDVTDAGVMKVTAFTLTQLLDPDGQPPRIPLGRLCTPIPNKTGCNDGPKDPVAGQCPNPPVLYVRRYDLVIQATAANDPTVKRQLRESIRVRNDRIDGACPTA